MFNIQPWLDGGGLTRTPAVTYAFSIQDWKDITAGVSSTVTALAVIIGGGWAYFKFFKGRTFRPRLAVRLAGQWRDLNGADVLHLRIWVTNIGASMVALKQYGSGLEVSFPSSEQNHDEVRWSPMLVAGGGETDVVRAFEVLTEHEWIEPGETVSDDLLLNLGRDHSDSDSAGARAWWRTRFGGRWWAPNRASAPSLALLELRLIWNTTGDRTEDHPEGDVEVFARQIIRRGLPMIDSLVPGSSQTK